VVVKLRVVGVVGRWCSRPKMMLPLGEDE
jgi:hypothetical protein